MIPSCRTWYSWPDTNPCDEPIKMNACNPRTFAVFSFWLYKMLSACDKPKLYQPLDVKVIKTYIYLKNRHGESLFLPFRDPVKSYPDKNYKDWSRVSSFELLWDPKEVYPDTKNKLPSWRVPKFVLFRDPVSRCPDKKIKIDRESLVCIAMGSKRSLPRHKVYYLVENL
jgi:hypothetical protein